MSKAPKYLTTDQLSYMFGVTPQTVIAYTKGDNAWLLPAKIARGKYDANMACRLYIENQIIPKFARPNDGCESIEEARRRKEIAMANLKELQEAQQRAELIPKDQAIDWLVGIISEAKSAFMAVPRRIAPVLYGLSEIRDIESKVRSEMTRILEKLSRNVKHDSE